MINFTNLQRNLTAAVGALVVSTTFIAAAVGPAQTVSPTQTAQVQTSARANA